jgi:hypothetical protein
MPTKLRPGRSSPGYDFAAKVTYRINGKKTYFTLGTWKTYEEAAEVESKFRTLYAQDPSKAHEHAASLRRPKLPSGVVFPEGHSAAKPYKAVVRRGGKQYSLGYWKTLQEKEAAIALFVEWWQYDAQHADDWVVEIRLPSVDDPRVINGSARNHPLVKQAIKEYEERLRAAINDQKSNQKSNSNKVVK